ncbi:L-threonylcarbamoyladenylate synthase [Vagococcus sp.]|uniref:L-threonylcarbamoyladenylate synthase n=1 Tax=Vagococcus sp. TaxID=1933889 RepID=UPI003F9C70F8
MKTKKLNAQEVAEAACLIKQGNLVSFPTETVYGLGADATNELAVKEVYLAKGRPSDNPLIVHIASPEALLPFVEGVSEIAQKLMKSFWPGPLTLIFKLKNNSVFSKAVTGGLETVAFRMPNNTLTLDLIQQSGTVLVGPSANSSGKPSPTLAEHVLHDLDTKISAVLDGGMCSVGIESTVVDVSDEQDVPTILRPGAITKEQLEQVVGEVRFDNHLVGKAETPKAPGMKYKHYSPDTPVLMVAGGAEVFQSALNKYKDNKVGVLANQALIDQMSGYEAAYSLSKKSHVKEAMQYLFAGLRSLDLVNPKLDLILVETYPNEGEGLAYMNRLKKAAGEHYFTLES